MDLQSSTSRYFESINFDELSEDWIGELINNEYTDVDENNMSISILFTEDPAKTIKQICAVCDRWASQKNLSDSFAGNNSRSTDNTLWSYLSSLDIQMRQISGVIYFLCSKAVKSSCSSEEKEYGLWAAKWYFSMLRIPGHGPYAVYHSNLFNACMDCLQVVDPDQKDNTWRMIENLLPVYFSVLSSLIPLLGTFHLGTDTSTVEHVIRRLCGLISVELTTSKFDFDADVSIMQGSVSRHNSAHAVAASAFQGLNVLIWGKLNGDADYNYEIILHHLIRYITCFQARKSTSSIPARFIAIKDNSLSYIKHNLMKDPELCSPVTLKTLHKLCLSVIDKTEFRNVVVNATRRVMCLLKPEDNVKMIQWLLQLVDAAETNNRVFGVEVLGNILEDGQQVDKEAIPEDLLVYLTNFPMIFAVLTRCDDVSPIVRTRSLAIVSHYIGEILTSLGEIQDISLLPREDFGDIPNYDINGEHRCFWYNLPSMRALLEEMKSIFHRRIDDNNGNSRKAALQALEHIVTFDDIYLSEENMKFFFMAAKDSLNGVRMQTVLSLSHILEKYPEKQLAQEFWMKSIMPLVQDPEKTVNDKVMDEIEQKFLVDVFSKDEFVRNRSFNLLQKLRQGKYLSHQRYLQRAFITWRTAKKIRGNAAVNLKPLLESEQSDLVWFYWSIFSGFCKFPRDICELAVTEYQSQDIMKNISVAQYVLKIISNSLDVISQDSLNNIETHMMIQIETFDAPVEVLPSLIEILKKLNKDERNSNDLEEFAKNMMLSSMDVLHSFTSKNETVDRNKEERVVRCFTVIKEFCQIFNSLITLDLIKSMKRYANLDKNEPTPRSVVSKRITPLLKAHAFAALGKMCLQDETLGKDLIRTFAKAAIVSSHDMIRNNVVLVLIEMCRRYTSLADQYIPIICECFKDRWYVIRFQCITLLIGLLQEEYIKWKGSLLFCLLSTLNDPQDSIQELGRYCMINLLLKKKKNLFLDSFIDALFIFNDFAHPTNLTLKSLLDRLKKFAIKGDKRRGKRTVIYSFMLSNIERTERVKVVHSICNDIFFPLAEGLFPINPITECLVRDCFTIILSDAVRILDSQQVINHLEADEEEVIAQIELDARKAGIVIPCIDALLKLYVSVREAKSELLDDIVCFLKDLLQDFRNDVPNLLVADKQLRIQVEYEFKKDIIQHEKEQHSIRRLTTKNSVRPDKPATASPEDDDEFVAPRTPQVVANQNRSHRVVGVDENVGGGSGGDDGAVPSTSAGFRHLLTSTPRVVLKPLSLLDLPNLSNIAMEEDEDD